MPPSPFPLFLRTALRSPYSTSFLPRSSSSPRHALSPFLPQKRFLSTNDTTLAPSPIFTESEQRREQERAKLDPNVLARREAILQEVKRQEESRGNQGEVRLSFTVLGPQGVVKHPHLAYTKAEICNSWNLHPRDVRPLDSNNAISPYIYMGRQNLVATILPRRKEALILNLLYIRALIRRDEVLILDSAEGLDSGLHRVFTENLVRHLQDEGNVEEPFSFRVLDSLLLSSALTLEAEMTLLRGTVLALLSDLEKEISRDGLKRLLSVSKDLSGLGERVGLVNDAVERCLVDDDIIALMDLSQPPVDRTAKGGLEDIELLLESFSQRVEEVISEVQTTTSNVESTQEIVELMLGTSRNALLVLDIKVSLLSLGIGAGTLVAGVFGMNLLSGYEETPDVFYIATAGLLGVAVVVTSLGLRRLAILRRVGLGVARGSSRGGNGHGGLGLKS